MPSASPAPSRRPERSPGPAPDRAAAPGAVAPHPAHEHASIDAATYFMVLEHVRRIGGHDLTAQPPDTDAIVDVALRRVQAGRSTVSSPDRYEGWVSVVCRNAYLNFIRSRRSFRSLEETDAVHDPVAGYDLRHDAEVVRAALLGAIGRLPRFLRDVARMRFAEHRSHSWIAEETGKALPIVRSYANKAARRLRDDPGLAAVLRDWRS